MSLYTEEVSDQRLEAVRDGESTRIKSDTYKEGDRVILVSPGGGRVVTEVLTISHQHGGPWAILLNPNYRSDQTLYI